MYVWLFNVTVDGNWMFNLLLSVLVTSYLVGLYQAYGWCLCRYRKILFHVSRVFSATCMGVVLLLAVVNLMAIFPGSLEDKKGVVSKVQSLESSGGDVRLFLKELAMLAKDGRFSKFDVALMDNFEKRAQVYQARHITDNKVNARQNRLERQFADYVRQGESY